MKGNRLIMPSSKTPPKMRSWIVSYRGKVLRPKPNGVCSSRSTLHNSLPSFGHRLHQRPPLPSDFLLNAVNQRHCHIVKKCESEATVLISLLLSLQFDGVFILKATPPVRQPSSTARATLSRSRNFLVSSPFPFKLGVIQPFCS